MDALIKPWTAHVLTLFPEMFPGPLGHSLVGTAKAKGLWGLDTVDIRDFAHDRHRTVDDTPYGGGAGMVMRPDVLDAALASVMDQDDAQGLGDRPLIYLTPRGRPLDQSMVKDFAKAPGVVVLCGRYEGVDQRVLDARNAVEVSLGDFVLTGGELAAMALLDATVRLIPGVIGKAESLENESFEEGLLEHPLYTRPQEWNGRAVPEVLLSGHHQKINAWRQEQSEAVTRERRPDLWAAYEKGKNQL